MAAGGRIEERVRAALPDVPVEWVRALGRALERLVVAFGPERIYLFGSRARGAARPDSDVDLLVVVPAGNEVPYRLAARAYTEIGPCELPLELVFMTRAEFERRARAAASLPAAVLREGLLLYAA